MHTIRLAYTSSLSRERLGNMLYTISFTPLCSAPIKESITASLSWTPPLRPWNKHVRQVSMLDLTN
jgi:hypothetical protein